MEAHELIEYIIPTSFRHIAIWEIYHVYVPALSYRSRHSAQRDSRQKKINLSLVAYPAGHHLILVQAPRHRSAKSLFLNGIST